ncbi:DUF6612 family protein [Phytomonospora endophytica]|uniref:Lipoprotein n=1 Tax=Phytomonospora endophytica TaxID=714109 RepID=A0A841FQY8_9ACTN|nr:DUF6612 family protein [Phytomonospora endophytica]MBB6037243.1 hypothetical protein [Phytomonospora endophytica]GIG71257.1 hypothetical protein Pen01_75520 [Phytomonospora endophytica]
MTLQRARTFAATLTVAALVALGAAGCGSGDNAELQGGAGNPATGENAPADAKGAVALAAEKTKQQSYRMTMTMDPEMTMEAVVDPVAKTGHTTMSINAEGVSLETEMILLDEDIYVKTTGDGPLASDKWMHMKSDGLGDAFSTSQVDPAEFLAGADEVVRVDEHTYTGVLDLSTVSAGAFGGGLGEKFGADFTEIPFTLTLDDEGRLSRMETTMKGMGTDGTDRTAVVTMSDYGTPVDVTAPPADQVDEMPGFGE